MAKKVGKRRLEVARDVVAMLFRDERFRDAVRKTGGEGRIVIASPNERMPSFFRRVQEAGFPATVCFRAPRKGVFVVHVEAAGNGPRHVHGDDVLEVHPNITMRCLVDALRDQGSVLVHLNKPREVDYRMVAADPADQDLVPSA